MQYPLPALRQYVETAWNAPGWAALRSKQQALITVRHNQHALPLPEDMEKRADAAALVGYAGEKVDRAKAIMSDPGGPQWTCGMIGSARSAEARRQQMESWVGGGWALMSQAAEGRLESAVLDDMLVCGYGLCRITPDPRIWDALDAYDPADATRPFDEVDELLDRAGFLPFEVDPASGKDVVDAASDRANAGVEAELRRRRQLMARSFPIVAAHVPATNAILRWDARGLAEVIEVREQPIRRILDDYRDDTGQPTAKALAELASYRHLTDDDAATVVIRADRTHMQVMVTGALASRIANQDTRTTASGATVDEFLFDGEHGLGRVPYVYFPGRETASSDPQRRWHPLIDNPVARQSQALDILTVQLLSVTRHAAWSGLVVQKDKDVAPPGTGERPKLLVIKEGGISTGLGPGESIARVPWVDPAAMDLLKYAIEQQRDTIDRHTFGTAVYGTHGAGSGYELAQLQAAAESVLAPFHGGYEAGLADAADLMLACGRFLLAHGFASVPVRVLDPDAGMAAYYDLDDRLAAVDWEFKASIIPQPVGGQYAKFQTIDQMVKGGYITQAEGQRRLGIRNGEAMRKAALVEQITYHPGNVQKLSEAALAATFQVLSNPDAPDLPPGQLALPAALAQALGQAGASADPALAARLPQGLLPPPGGGGLPPLAPGPGPLGTPGGLGAAPGGGPPTGGLAGLPNLAMQTGALPPPGGPPDQLGALGLPRIGMVGSQPGGEAAPIPGGMGRMDYTLSQPRP